MRKSILASLLISLGVYILLKIGAPLGAFLFSLGLMGVCVLGADLFTGKCGFQNEGLLKMLFWNLLAGFLFGRLIAITDPSLVQVAFEKIVAWDNIFLRSLWCGAVMYVAVKMFKKDNKFGVLFGVPLFILCGMQHSIANIITLGVAGVFDWRIFVCVLGNFLGSRGVRLLDNDK